MEIGTTTTIPLRPQHHGTRFKKHSIGRVVKTSCRKASMRNPPFVRKDRPMQKFDPIPYLRIIDRARSPMQAGDRVQVLQVGHRPIGDGPISWHDVPVIREEELSVKGDDDAN
jgi:hypothetical protein